MNDTLRDKLALLPERPGCYLMKDEAQQVIYVGKANVLKHRVRSYFTGTHEGKTQRLVERICDVETIVTTNRREAFILECNLIKQYRPKYNVLLKDDKTFPYIKITADVHPRLEIVRKVLPDHALYFGPYPNGYAAMRTKQLLDRLYPLRKCKTLPKEVCLYYHMKQCLAPCVYDLPSEAESDLVKAITKFLRGDHGEVRAQLRQQMEEASEALQYERAKELRDTLQAIEALMERQQVTAVGGDGDVFGVAVSNGWMAVHIFYVREGKITSRNVTAFPYYGEAYDDFLTYVAQYYSDNPARPSVVYLPHPERVVTSEQEHPVVPASTEVAEWFADAYRVKVQFPKIGLHAQRVRLACDNATVSLEGHLQMKALQQERSEEAVTALAAVLGVTEISRIELFDNAHTRGTDAVSAMVVWGHGGWMRKQYRKFIVRRADGNDDYAVLREVLRRRYVRVLREQTVLPDAVFVDGGKGHVHAARDVLWNELGIAVPVFGLAKDDRHRFALLIGGEPPMPIALSRDSAVFHLLQRMQDEVHRVAVSFHQQKRSQRSFASILDRIEGIGPQRKKKLLQHFGSVQAMRTANVAQMRTLGLSEAVAQRVLDAIQK